MVGFPTGFLWGVDDWEVPVIWIVKVARVVDIYHCLVGRSRGGGVGRVKQTGNVRGAGGGSVLVLSEHSVFEGYGQKHVHGGGGKGTEVEDRGKGGWDGGTEDLLVYRRVAQNAVLGPNAVSFIFSQEPTAISRLGYPLLLLLFSCHHFKLDFVDIYFPSFRCRTPTRTTRLPAGSFFSRAWRYDGPGSPV